MTDLDLDAPDPDDEIKAGDPRYDGYRITHMWVITQVDPADDQEGLVVTEGVPLMAADDVRKAQMLDFAAEAYPGLPMVLKHFVLESETVIQ
jgi:hypothetical protein